MPRRILPAMLFLALLSCLALGCTSSTQDQNYKVLEEDRPMFETRPDPSKPGARQTTPANAQEAQVIAAASAASGVDATIDAPAKSCCAGCSSK